MAIVELEKDSQREQDEEEEKISSSSMRMRLLGTTLKPPLKRWSGKGAYVVGLTGTSASGKSSIAGRLEGMGAVVVDCDRLGHQAYEPGTECFDKVNSHLGSFV